ncbi:HNH endonuclease signature motif containing protein [Nitrosospira multiformis]|uniref:HNH endonuclease signature motif containing protein n=1 Tax=Nitrosospira multiformis TaxID=1231 RepID=UPI001C319184
MPSLYNYRWQQERKVFLGRNPFCAQCAKQGKRTIATIVDHIIPHKGDLEKFWNKDNWQAMCKPCHDSHKQRLEKSGRVIGCDASGRPVDPNHHWNRE